MPTDSLPLIVGTLLALGALSFVLLPLLSESEPDGKPAPGRVRSALDARKAASAEEDGLAVSALREIEFDRATGKLSDSDYEELKAKYTALALADLRAQDDRARAAEGAVPGAAAPVASVAEYAAGAGDDPVEAAVRAAEARRPKCGTCGPRPESDAIYCSDCGSYLPGACGSCGTKVNLPGARFCNACGGQLAAA